MSPSGWTGMRIGCSARPIGEGDAFRRTSLEPPLLSPYIIPCYHETRNVPLGGIWN